MDISIKEKVKAVFEWAGFKIDLLPGRDPRAGIMVWITPDIHVINSKRGYGKLPMPDDIEFLGYMDKYVESKLLENNYAITQVSNINTDTREKIYFATITKRRIAFSETYSTHSSNIKNIALLNAIYEVISK